MNLTDKEKEVLKAIVDSEYQSGELVGTQVWTYSARPNGYTQPEFRGVLSSLTKKELIEVGDYDSKGDVVAITQVGFDILQTA